MTPTTIPPPPAAPPPPRRLHAQIDGHDQWFSSPSEKFAALLASWNAGRRPSPFINDLVTHPAYQQIIGMGADALPLIFREFPGSSANWHWALAAITGEDPVPKGATDRQSITAAWTEWGRSHGYLPA